jgi:hypothetical protein
MVSLSTTNFSLLNSARVPLLQSRTGRFFEADLLLLRRQAH